MGAAVCVLAALPGCRHSGWRLSTEPACAGHETRGRTLTYPHSLKGQILQMVNLIWDENHGLH